MERWHFTMTRWPERAFSIGHRIKDDETFCEMVSDYELARSALRHWSTKSPPDPERVAEYTQIVRELEQEIEANLNSP